MGTVEGNMYLFQLIDYGGQKNAGKGWRMLMECSMSDVVFHYQH